MDPQVMGVELRPGRFEKLHGEGKAVVGGVLRTKVLEETGTGKLVVRVFGHGNELGDARCTRKSTKVDTMNEVKKAVEQVLDVPP